MRVGVHRVGGVAGEDLLLQVFQLLRMAAHGGIVAVIRQAQPLQDGVDAGAARGLVVVLQPGKGDGAADAAADLLLCQAQVQPPLADKVAEKKIFHDRCSRSFSGFQSYPPGGQNAAAQGVPRNGAEQ